MKKLSIGAKVSVNGVANQWPFERICDTGTILDNVGKGRAYLVALDVGRESLLFFRRDLSIDSAPVVG